MKMNRFSLLVFLSAIISVHPKGLDESSSRPAPWYDCLGKQPGNYLHPYDCTRFITCDAGLEAIEFDCGACSNRPEVCNPQNRLTYSASLNTCVWADQTECELGPGGTTTEEPGPPEIGKPCNPDSSEGTGYCQVYLRCDLDTRKWIENECINELIWNQAEAKCDSIENLDPELVREYRKDTDCLACFWKATGECEQEYLFQAPHLRFRNVQTLRCSDGLLFSQEKRTCQRCNNVERADGSLCC